MSKSGVGKEKALLFIHGDRGSIFKFVPDRVSLYAQTSRGLVCQRRGLHPLDER